MRRCCDTRPPPLGSVSTPNPGAYSEQQVVRLLDGTGWRVAFGGLNTVLWAGWTWGSGDWSKDDRVPVPVHLIDMGLQAAHAAHANTEQWLQELVDI